MRSAIVCITTLATLIHLACGCCLHAAAVEGGAVCCGAQAADHRDDDCCDESSHDHAADEGSGASVGHRCDGCRCAAMIDAETLLDRIPAVVAQEAAFDADVIAARQQVACGLGGAVGPPVPAALRPPLFERLTV